MYNLCVFIYTTMRGSVFSLCPDEDWWFLCCYWLIGLFMLSCCVVLTRVVCYRVCDVLTWFCVFWRTCFGISCVPYVRLTVSDLYSLTCIVRSVCNDTKLFSSVLSKPTSSPALCWLFLVHFSGMLEDVMLEIAKLKAWLTAFPSQGLVCPFMGNWM